MLVLYRLRSSLLPIFLAASSVTAGHSQTPISNVAERHAEVAGSGKLRAFSIAPTIPLRSVPHLEKRGSAPEYRIAAHRLGDHRT
jgi:hypothetical protein